MKMSSAFPSDYFKAVDFEEAPQKLVMSKVVMKDIGEDHKPVLFFQGNEKGLVLNKTNANTIAEAYGDESENWSGKEIVVFASTTDLRGQQVACIRVRKPKQQAKLAAATAKHDPDDEIPF